MEISVRYATVSKPVNLNCKCGVILEYLRSCANLDPNILLDLSDKEGNVKLLRQNLTSYATGILSPGETYFLVSTQEDPKVYNYTLMATLAPEEPPFEIKPTKAEKKEKKSSGKSSSKKKKSA